MVNNKSVYIMFIVLIATIISFGVVTEGFTANHYIREGAIGNNDGSDWTNAWTELPATLTRGDTYYIGDGTYAEYTFDDAEDGATYITILKATESEHGSNTGWSSAYGDGQTVFYTNGNASAMTFRRGYYKIDGAVGSGSDSTTYGIKLTTHGDGEADYQIVLKMGVNNMSYITVSRVAMVCPGEDVGSGLKAQHCVYMTGAEFDHVTFEKCYMGGGGTNMMFLHWADCTIDSVYFDGNWSSSAQHGQQISAAHGCLNVTVKNCTFKDSEGFVVAFHEESGDNYNWDVYNNLILGGGVTAAFGATDTDNLIRGHFHHNTCVDVTMGGRGFVFTDIQTETDSTSFAYNNLFYNCTNPIMTNADGTPNMIMYDYNAYFDSNVEYPGENAIMGTGNPFVDSANLDFHLIFPIPVKNNLGQPFNIDINGNTRGSDGIWDVGAFEFQSAVPIVLSLYQNYPNPFNSQTTIEYQIPSFTSGENVNLAIFNILGQRVRELVNANKPPGKYNMIWNGRDERGREVSSGQYLYLLISGKFRTSKKMVFMK